jgi:hypothetical protein
VTPEDPRRGGRPSDEDADYEVRPSHWSRLAFGLLGAIGAVMFSYVLVVSPEPWETADYFAAGACLVGFPAACWMCTRPVVRVTRDTLIVTNFLLTHRIPLTHLHGVLVREGDWWPYIQHRTERRRGVPFPAVAIAFKAGLWGWKVPADAQEVIDTINLRAQRARERAARTDA